MALNAKQVAIKTEVNRKPIVPVEDYLEQRINDAAERGFTSSKIWIRPDSLEEARAILKAGNFRITKIDDDPRGSERWEVSW